MQLFIGYAMIIVGLLMEILAILVWLGIVKPAPQTRTFAGATPWDFLIALLQKAPWTAVVGLALIYGGLHTIGVSLPF